MRNQRASTSRRPSFFKPMIGDFKNTIRIPVAFTRRLSPAIYTISDPTGSSRWDVTVNKVEQDLFFTTGWPSFVQQNSLDLGDLVVFTYLVGTFNFEVKAFGLNGCGKPLFQPHAKNPTEEQICETHLKSPSSIPGQISLRKSKRLVLQEKKGKTIQHVNSTEEDGLDSLQNETSGFTSMCRSENSSCKIVLTRSYLSRGFMHCPSKFVRCLTKNPTGRFNLRLKVANGKIWHVVLTCSKRKAYLCTGWAEFVKKNNLRQGDVCLMEIIKRGKLDLKVSINRKASATPAK